MADKTFDIQSSVHPLSKFQDRSTMPEEDFEQPRTVWCGESGAYSIKGQYDTDFVVVQMVAGVVYPIAVLDVRAEDGTTLPTEGQIVICSGR